MKQNYLRRIYWQLTGIIMLAVMAALAANSYFSHRAFEQSLVPELAKKAESVGTSVAALMLRAIGAGIPLQELYGVDQTFVDMKEENPEFDYIAVTDRDGKLLFQFGKAPAGIDDYLRSPAALAGSDAARADMTGAGKAADIKGDSTQVGSLYMVSQPIESGPNVLGVLHIGIASSFVDNIILELLFDVVVVLVVALFFTLELLNFIAGARLEAGLRSLAGILQRGGNGDFSLPPARAASSEFGGVVALLESAVARVNAGFLALTRDIEAARRDPVHERGESLSLASAGLRNLSQRFRFGDAATAQADDGDGRLAQVRTPLFAFILAEELTRSFLPTYVKSLAVPIPGLSAEIVVGLPIALFMLIVALAQPHLGALCARIGARRTMLWGAGVAAFGLATSALASSVFDLLLWRSLCAFGYAMVFVAAQAYVLDHTGSSNRARGFALFVGAIMVASVCGPSIGGILADNIGERATFLVAALLAAGSILAIRLLPDHGSVSAEREVARVPRLAEIGTLVFNRRFITLTGLAAVPAKIVLTGICFYLVPLFVVSLNATQAMAGRILMCYAVVMVLVAPLAASIAVSRESREQLVSVGLILSGLGGLVLLAGASVTWVFAAVLLIGLGQSLSITAQSALVTDHCKEEIARMGDSVVYGVYRLLERLGNAIGPLVAAALVMRFGYQGGFIAIGMFAVICGLAFFTLTQSGAQQSEHAVEAHR